MTNPTPHGQVPEALRLANAVSNLTRYSMDAHLIAAELRRQHARIAELEAQIEALSGVQALSAAPEAFLKSVIALCSHRGYSPANIEAWDKDDKWIADLWRQAESMLAASPTPPAEQQAQPGAVGRTGCTAGTDEECTRRGCATSCPAQQAAPKAAPAQQAGEAAESVPAREHDLQDVRCECCGYMTYHREHMGCIHAARAPADNVQEDAAWMPLTPELLTAIESGDLGNRFWIAAHNSNEPQIGVYEWQQGRNPHGFNSDLSRYGASEITHVLPYKPPALPAASSPQSKEKSNDR